MTWRYFSKARRTYLFAMPILMQQHRPKRRGVAWVKGIHPSSDGTGGGGASSIRCGCQTSHARQITVGGMVTACGLTKGRTAPLMNAKPYCKRDCDEKDLALDTICRSVDDNVALS